VLLIHGYSASLQAWEPLIALLRDRYRFVSIDLPGHGLTRAPADYRPSIERYVSDVAAFVGAERLERFSIAGSSMGGNLAWEYVLAHPQGVAALILVDAAGWPDPRPGAGPPAAIRALLQQPVVGPMLRDLDGTQIMRDGLLQAFADPTLVDEPMVRRYTELARAPGAPRDPRRADAGAPSATAGFGCAAGRHPRPDAHSARLARPADPGRAGTILRGCHRRLGGRRVRRRGAPSHGGAAGSNGRRGGGVSSELGAIGLQRFRVPGPPGLLRPIAVRFVR
jgi:pimeloyl-ACP methyl ester carboxylesterase